MTAKTGLHLQGAAELKKIMTALGPEISKRAGVTGVRKAAMVMRRDLKNASPKVTGTLQREWMYKKLRSRRAASYVGYVVKLRRRHYFEVLEFESARGKPLHPFAERAIDGAKNQAMATMIAATRTALAAEAGKAFAKSKRIR